MKNISESIVNQSHPLVSVVMSVFNTPKEPLFDAVRSILNQTYINFEFIIIDDCSKVEFYCDPIFLDKRIKIYKNSKNGGCGFSFNKGVSLAKGKYIARMDSDDISLPTRLEKQVGFMETHPDVVACGTWFKFFGSKNHEVKRVIDDNEYYRCCLFFDNVPTLLHPSVMIRRETLEVNKINYDPNLRGAEDYKLWCQLTKVGVVTNYKEVLVHYRVHENQITNSNKYLDFIKDHKVGNELIKEIGVDFNDEEKELFFNYLKSKRYSAIKYSSLLDKVASANKISKIYDQNKFNLRVHEQWVSVVQHIKNPFKLFSFFINQKGRRMEILKIKNKQLFKKS